MCYCRPDIRTPFCASCSQKMYLDIVRLTKELSDAQAIIVELQKNTNGDTEALKRRIRRETLLDAITAIEDSDSKEYASWTLRRMFEVIKK